MAPKAFHVDDVFPPKTYPISMKNLSDLTNSIACVAVGQIFEILKIDEKIHFLPKNLIFKQKNKEF